MAITYGLIVRTAGLSPLDAALSSALVFAGAAQFLAVGLYGVGVAIPQILFAGWMLNVRHLLMSSVIARNIPPAPVHVKGLMAFGVTDEVFGVAGTEISVSTPISLARLAGLELGAYSAWVGGTVIGALAGEVIPPGLKTAMGLALYVLFTALLAGQIKRGPVRQVVVAAATAAAVNIVLRYGLAAGPGIAFPIAMVAGGVAGMSVPERQR